VTEAIRKRRYDGGGHGQPIQRGMNSHSAAVFRRGPDRAPRGEIAGLYRPVRDAATARGTTPPCPRSACRPPSDAGPRLAAPTMSTPRPPLAHEPGRLRGLLHEGVGQLHAVLAPGDLRAVAHVEAGVPVAGPVAVAVEGEQPLHFGPRHRRGEGVRSR
jgi:hypothetical protein